jgi:hypothetical protein
VYDVQRHRSVIHVAFDAFAARLAHVVTSTVLLLVQVKVIIQNIRAACERPVDKIERQQLRKHAHQLADYCKDGGWGKEYSSSAWAAHAVFFWSVGRCQQPAATQPCRLCISKSCLVHSDFLQPSDACQCCMQIPQEHQQLSLHVYCGQLS